MSFPSFDPDRHPVDVLAEEFADRLRRGERPTVNDYAERYPQYADELRAALPPIALMERLKLRNLSGSTGGRLAGVAPLPERLGDFRIVRELGRGGMGVVYEARQESLGGRLVAVKVLDRAGRLDPQRLDRFEREARAAAALHHPHIVPVFGVGQADGLHFIVMQMIAGQTLADMVRQLAGGPSHPGDPASQTSGVSASARPADLKPPVGRAYWRWVAEIGRQAADALAYAHRHGVLHRDVKAGNLLLDAAGGEVFVTDFGLAKVGEAPTDVTRAGDIIGTLQYMAPEALQSPPDARGDVYGLGATLYELLTLRPPNDAPTPAAMMQRLSKAEPPAPPRRICPHVPVDLETIVLRACGPTPAQRYASADDLAQDLANFLADRPIMARRVSPLERGWRWCRRNRTVAALGSLAVLAVVSAAVVGWAAYAATSRALSAEASQRVAVEQARQQAESARQSAEQARARAEQNVELSLAGFEEIFDKLAPPDDRPPPLPGDRPAGGRPGGPPGGPSRRPAQDAAVLKSILSFYDRFTQGNRTNTRLQAEAARAYRRVGDSYIRLGLATDAAAAYQRSIDLYQSLLSADPSEVSHRLGLAEAALALWTDAPPDAAVDAALTRTVADAVAQIDPATIKSGRHLDMIARVLMRDGRAKRAANDLAGAEARYLHSAEAWAVGRTVSRAPGDSDSTPPRPPDELDRRYVALLALADVQTASGRPGEARRTLLDVWSLVDRPLPERTGSPPRPIRGGLPAERTALFESIAKLASAAEDAELAARACARAAEWQAAGPPPRPGRSGDMP